VLHDAQLFSELFIAPLEWVGMSRIDLPILRRVDASFTATCFSGRFTFFQPLIGVRCHGSPQLLILDSLRVAFVLQPRGCFTINTL
jgi:hypothetical protein